MSRLDKITEEFKLQVARLENWRERNLDYIRRMPKPLYYKKWLLGRISQIYNHYLRLYEQEFQRKQQELKKQLRALVVGINYVGINGEDTSWELRGCINDARNLSEYLVDSKNVESQNQVCCVTDDTDVKPTREVILNKYREMLEKAEAGDILYFTFAGHGTYTLDRSGDEEDGKDEVLVCLDKMGIRDDELKMLTMVHLKEGVNVVILFDCCHSGTLMDLKYSYLSGEDYAEVATNTKSVETKGNVYLISGCRDDQTSADAYINRKFQGAMSWAFLRAMKEKKEISWKELLLRMRELLKPYYTQVPQLSSGRELDINSKIIMRN